MGDYNATVTDDGKVILSRKGAGAPAPVAVEEIVDPDGTEVVTPEMPAEPADDPKPRRGRASSDD